MERYQAFCTLCDKKEGYKYFFSGLAIISNFKDFLLFTQIIKTIETCHHHLILVGSIDIQFYPHY